ncbi:TPA: hypothetical protein QDB28_000019 [Burkholderia vietnamiensis]|uniref:hypothetical protein n=1 Tax=Burkholderia vietnamiensis TaxID=60552 RepID=UPI0015899F46|nr:hypothetical protein [Burkholderia vietnamiensis]HDR9159702.1 hypothetical protein [Burkholderia vietnamiensis]
MVNFDAYDIGNHRITCPACGRGPRDKTLGLTIEADGAGVAHCFRCSFTEGYRPDRGVHLTMPSKPRIKAASPTAKHDSLSDYGRELWDACKPLSGIARAYLEARRCRIPRDPQSPGSTSSAPRLAGSRPFTGPPPCLRYG